MEPIRVLQVVTCMDTGGIETLLMNFYRKMDRDKVQFDFLVHRKKKGFYDEEILSMGGRIYNMPKINPLFPVKYNKSLSAFFDKHPEYSIIHSHINTFSKYPLKVATKKGVKTRIAHSHIAYPKFNYKWFPKAYAKINLKNYCSHLFACSKIAGQWLYGRHNKDFKVIHNAVDTQRFIYNEKVREDKRRELGLDNKIILGHVGRLTAQKNHMFILEIFNDVHKMNNDAVLILIGDGILKEQIIEKIKALDLEDCVKMLGVRPDVPELLQSMDFFVFPSHFEGLPVTLVEAQAAGLPIIMSDKVTDEVVITDLVKVKSLEDSATIWAKEIISFNEGFEKSNMQKEIKAAGYDSEDMAKWLGKFYLECN